MTRLIPSALGALMLLTTAAVAQPAGVCRPGQTDKAERPAPAAVLPRLGQVFGVAPDTLRAGSYVRCAGGHLLGCMVGANLNCGHADTNRHSKGGDAFCHDSPNADVVPMAATGHDTVYDWHCVGTRAVAGKRATEVDRLGFDAGNWRPVP